MSKLDQILASSGANIDSSMGAGRRARPLHGATASSSGAPGRLQGVARSKDAAEVPVAKIVRDEDQPREEFEPEAIGRLAESLRTRGQLQPIRVRWDESRGAYVLVCGERRWRAAQMAGLVTLSCIIMDRPADAGELLALQLIENILREDLQPIEAARAYQRLMQAQGWSARQLAAELAINPSTITRTLALLELPQVVQEQVEAGHLAPATAYEIGKLPEPLRAEVAQAAVSEGLKRSEVADLVQAVKAKRPAPTPRPDPISFDLGSVVVKVIWKKADGPDLVRALRQALKLAQARDDQAV